MQRTPSQTVGPFFLDALIHAGDESAAQPASAMATEIIVLEGVVADGEGNPVGDAFLEIFDPFAPNSGTHPNADHHIEPAGFARAATHANGEFRFITHYPGAATDRQAPVAPHLEIMIFARGLLKPLVTRVYFDGDAHNEQDSVLNAVPASRRATLMARRSPSANPSHWKFDIRLQGANETVFFDF